MSKKPEDQLTATEAKPKDKPTAQVAAKLKVDLKKLGLKDVDLETLITTEKTADEIAAGLIEHLRKSPKKKT